MSESALAIVGEAAAHGVVTLEPVGGALLHDAIRNAILWLKANGRDYCMLRFNDTKFPVYLDPADAAAHAFYLVRYK